MLTCRCQMLCGICIVQIYSREQVIHRVGYRALIRQGDLITTGTDPSSVPFCTRLSLPTVPFQGNLSFLPPWVSTLPLARSIPLFKVMVYFPIFLLSFASFLSLSFYLPGIYCRLLACVCCPSRTQHNGIYVCVVACDSQSFVSL